MTKLNLEVQDLKNRVLQLQGRLELQVRREKTLEEMVVYRSDAPAETVHDERRGVHPGGAKDDAAKPEGKDGGS
jgi:hypothetical protein